MPLVALEPEMVDPEALLLLGFFMLDLDGIKEAQISTNKTSLLAKTDQSQAWKLNISNLIGLIMLPADPVDPEDNLIKIKKA